MVVSFPKVKPRKEFPIGGGLGSQGRCLTAHVGLPEQDSLDAPVLDRVVDLEQFLFRGDLADDDGICRVVLEELACFVGGVNSLDDLLRE